MIEFDKPENLNGAELLAELMAVGINLNPSTQTPVVDGNGKLWLDIQSKDKDKVQKVVSAHNGTIIAPEATIIEKLASVGLSINDLKAALGL
jgi:hypothetical protein